MPEPVEIGRKSAVLSEFRRALRAGLVEEAGKPGLLAIEGPRLIDEAIRSGWKIEKALFSRTGLAHHGARLLPQLSRHAQVSLSDDAAFASAADAENPQGVAALARLQTATLEDAFAGAAPLVVAAAELQDPGNLGTLIRAADGFGASGVVVLSGTVSAYNPKTVRASAGSLFHLPVVTRVTARELMAACEAHGVRLLATAARGETAAREVDWRQPSCLVIGQEAGGVPRELLRAAAERVGIPMRRELESLNAGVAGAILLYEAARQRADAANSAS